MILELAGRLAGDNDMELVEHNTAQKRKDFEEHKQLSLLWSKGKGFHCLFGIIQSWDTARPVGSGD